MKTWFTEHSTAIVPRPRSQAAKQLGPKHRARLEKARIGVGHVVEFITGKTLRCGAVVSDRRRYIRVLDQDGAIVPVDKDKAVDLSSQQLNPWQPQGKTVVALRQISQRREELKCELDIRPLWELAIEADNDEWSLSELTELYFGEDPGSDKRCALARALNDGHHFNRRGHRFVPLAREVVAQHDENEKQARAEEQWLEDVARWLRSVANGSPTDAPADHGRAIRLLEGEALVGKENPDAREAARLTSKAHLHGPVAAFNVLVKLGHWDENENLDLLRHKIPVSFPVEIEEQECVWTKEAALASRLWFGRVFGVSNAGANGDRAISVRRSLFGGTKIGIHFASPSLVMPPESPFLSQAVDRGVSHCLPDRSIPMLPQQLTSQVRLSETERRPALTAELRLNSSLEVVSREIKLKRIRITDVLPFYEDPSRVSADAHLNLLHQLALQLRSTRREAGAVIICEPEVDISVEDGKVSVRLLDAGSPVKLIWEELRILANSFIGEFCERHAVPAFYRVEPSIPENLLAEDDYDPIAVRNQKRIMPRARLQADPEPHHGLGVEHYVPIDSALHRYTDLLMYQQLVNLLVTDEPRYSPDDLRQAFLQTAWCRETRRDIETKSRRYWLLKYLEGFTGQDLEGVVLERLRHGCLVQLSNCLLWSFAPASPDERLSPGDRIRVAVNGVSARRNTIQLANPQRVQG